MDASKIFSVIATSLTMILNIVGLKLIWDIRNIKPTQKVLLTNLSISDALNAIATMAGIIIIEFFFEDDEKNAFATLAAYCILASCQALIIITIDRVIAAAIPLKYKLTVTKRRLISLIALIWVINLISVVILWRQFKVDNIHAYTFFITAPTELVIFTSYAFILLKTGRSRRSSTVSMKSFTETRRGKKMILVSSCIVLSFAVFVVIPDICLYFTEYNRGILISVIQVYYFINPVIYIYCFPPLRMQIMVKMRAIRKMLHHGHQIKDENKKIACKEDKEEQLQ